MTHHKILTLLLCTTSLLFPFEDMRPRKILKSEEQIENRSMYDKYWEHGDIKRHDHTFNVVYANKRVNATRKLQFKRPIPRNLVYMILDMVERDGHDDIWQSLEDEDEENKTLLEKIQSSEKYETIKNNKALCTILDPLFWKKSLRACIQKFEAEMLEIEKNKNK